MQYWVAAAGCASCPRSSVSGNALCMVLKYSLLPNTCLSEVLMLSTNVKFMPCDYVFDVARAAAATGPGPPVPAARHPGRSLTLISESCTLVHARHPPAARRGHGGARCPAARTVRRPPGARRATSRYSGWRRRPKAAATRGGGGGGSGHPGHGGRGATAGRAGVDTHVVAGGRVAIHTPRHEGVCECVCVHHRASPGVGGGSKHSALRLQQSASAHAHANTAGWPTRAHAPTE